MYLTVDILQHVLKYLDTYDLIIMCEASYLLAEMIKACDKKRYDLSWRLMPIKNEIIQLVKVAQSSIIYNMPQIERTLKIPNWMANIKLYSDVNCNDPIKISSALICWFKVNAKELLEMVFLIHKVLVTLIPNIYINFSLPSCDEKIDDNNILTRLNNRIQKEHVYYFYSAYRTFSLNKQKSM